MIRKKTRQIAIINSTLGFVLGLGAPLGYILFSFFFLNLEGLSLESWIQTLWHQQFLLLVYLTLPTLFVFSTFGYLLGLQTKKLALKTIQMEEFLHIAAHDIRSPLNIMKQAIFFIKDGIAGPVSEKQLELLNMLNRQTEIMNELMTELLDLHKMETGKFEIDLQQIPLFPLIKKAIDEMDLFVRQAKSSINLICEIDKESSFFMDAFRIRQLFRNLISNATKHVPSDGKIEIRIFQKKSNAIEVTLFNEGPLIPEDKLLVIFDKFVQVKDRTQKLGVGLGLAICKQVMDLHHGKIWVENVKSSGVCFHLIFPRKT